MIWRLKILIKIVLSHLPFGYSAWRKFGIFRLGSMEQGEYALNIFKIHIKRAYPEGMPPGLTCLELGPGDSVAAALIANAFGAKEIYLVDTGNFVTHDMKIYRSMIRWLSDQGYSTIEIERTNSLQELLDSCNAQYLTDGYRSLQTIQSQSIDFIWSHSVLEHISKHDFDQTFSELRRVIKPDGHMSHNVDLMDHLGGALNNLRFSERLWENNYFANSGFYTNRIRYSEMATIMEDAGFQIDERDYSKWPELPTNKSAMATPFRGLSEEELSIRCCHYLLSPKHG